MLKNKIVSMIAAGLLVFGVAACAGETAEDVPGTTEDTGTTDVGDDPAADDTLEDDTLEDDTMEEPTEEEPTE